MPSALRYPCRLLVALNEKKVLSRIRSVLAKVGGDVFSLFVVENDACQKSSAELLSPSFREDMTA